MSAHFVDEQHGASLRDVVAYDVIFGEGVAPLGGVAAACHQLAGARVVLLHVRVVAHGRVSESPLGSTVSHRSPHVRVLDNWP